MASKNELLKKRWDVLRALGLPGWMCREARTSARRFTEALKLAGKDASQHPELLNTFKGTRATYSCAKDAVESRERRRQLKAAGMDWVRVDAWSRSRSATEYALRAIREGRGDALPERPALVRKFSTSRRAQLQRQWRAQLKAAGLDVRRADTWSRTEANTQYALRAAAAGRADKLPERPGLMRAALKAAKLARDGIVTAAVLVLLCLNGWGCSAFVTDPPEFFVISDEFSESERDTIRDVFAAWCDAADYCPTEAIWADRGRVILVDDLPEDGYTRRHCPEGRTCTTNGVNVGGKNIEIAANRVEPDSLGHLWVDVAHEVGHYCALDHTDRGLMSPTRPDGMPLEIDSDAVEAWHSGCAM